jgi:PAS domain S-box-containing protein
MVLRSGNVTHDTVDDVRRAIQRRRRRTRLEQSTLLRGGLQQLLDHAVRLVSETLKADLTLIVEPVARRNLLQIVAGQGIPTVGLPKLIYSPDELPFTDYALHSSGPVTSRDMTIDPRFSGSDLVQRYGMLSAVGTAIRHQATVYGAVVASRQVRRRSDRRAIDFIQEVANVLAFAITGSLAEQRLADSERRYRHITESSPDVIYRLRIRPDFAYEYVSPAVTLLTGYRPEEFYADPNTMKKLIHPDDWPKLEQGLANPDSVPASIVLRWIRKDGEMVWAELRRTNVRGADGRVVAVEGIARDISDRRDAAAIEYGRAHHELERLAVLEDRGRIARDLHDGIVQSLFAAGMTLRDVHVVEQIAEPARARLHEVARTIDNAIEDLRKYVHNLQPGMSGGSLASALHRLARDFEKGSGIACRASLQAGAVRGITENVAAQTLQIVREALSNIARHSAASTCAIELRNTAEGTIFEVRDNGIGFSTDTHRQGLGLTNIATRAALIGAQSLVSSELGRGTVVRVTVPR